MPFDVLHRIVRPLSRRPVTSDRLDRRPPVSARGVLLADEPYLAERPDLGDDAERLRVAIRQRFGGSLHVRHLDSGSSNAADWEITALLNPYYDVQRLGIDFVASPRHADLLLVTGVMTRNLEDAALRTYEAMPEPRLVVGVGDEAIDGGVFAGSYASRGGIGEVLPVDVWVPGSPPRPDALIRGLLLATGRVRGSQRGSGS